MPGLSFPDELGSAGAQEALCDRRQCDSTSFGTCCRYGRIRTSLAADRERMASGLGLGRGFEHGATCPCRHDPRRRRIRLRGPPWIVAYPSSRPEPTGDADRFHQRGKDQKWRLGILIGVLGVRAESESRESEDVTNGVKPPDITTNRFRRSRRSWASETTRARWSGRSAQRGSRLFARATRSGS